MAPPPAWGWCVVLAGRLRDLVCLRCWCRICVCWCRHCRWRWVLAGRLPTAVGARHR